ncbi:Hypothetical protein NTJ_02579 [Nesidiocoris tenuis]|uniref:Uncharacterized protein n=1 Tax=Nesidiocoris tenuis TaxID=355587 RepID=A0ABN7ABT1_9HEMI|nr:Hypothetical protein NTJ_02579 [Nesidiocoris tenuis]
MYFGLRDLSSLGTNPRDLKKMLGIWVDPKLNRKAHCEQLSASLSSVTFLLRRPRDCLSGDAVLRAYHAVFHSRMSYCLLCWGHSPSAALIFGCQRRAVRAVLRRGYRSDVNADLAKIGVLTLPGQYILDCLVYIHANLDSSPQVSHAYCTRNAVSLVVPNCRLNVA